jgi:cytochrome c oxidase cbb3-type subunit 3
MPKLPLKPEQIASLLDFIGSRSGTAPAPASAPAAAVAHVTLDRGNRGHALYQIYCTQCHGLKGDGKGINAPSLFIAPRNHTSADEMAMLTDDRIFAAIKYGGTAVGKSALMPPWNGTIPDADIRLLVGYVRSLSGTQISDGGTP